MSPALRLFPFIAYLFLAEAVSAQLTFHKYAASSIFPTQYRPNVVACDDGGFALLNTWNYNGTGFGDHNFMRFGPNGDTLWTRNFLDHCNMNSLWRNADGGFFFQGLNDHGTSLFSIERTDANGARTWRSDHQLFGFSDQEFVPRKGFETATGDFVVAGDLGSIDQGPDSAYIGLARFSAAGVPLSGSIYSSDGRDAFALMFPTPDGGSLLGGGHRPGNAPAIREAEALHLDAAGDTLWTRKFLFANADYSWLQAATVTHDGGYLFQGTFHETQFGLTNTFLIRTNAMGDTLWSRIYQTIFNGRTLIEMPDHRIALVPEGSQLVFFDSTGTLLNFHTYGIIGGYADFNSGALLNDGGLLCAGFTYEHHDPGFDQAMYMVKTDGYGVSGCEEVAATYSFEWPTVITIGHVPMVRHDKPMLTPVQWSTNDLEPKEIVDLCNSTGVPQHQPLAHLVVGPMPAGASCRIGFTDPMSGQLSFYDLRGTLVHSVAVRAQRAVSVDVGRWAPGLYLVRACDDHGLLRTGKLIVE